uniref:Uncharacterized protein n=2 Tax=Proboscia inermis TaxID=420281 RepID=A0A7S0GGN2_9STRA|mmetsp:Transcript_47053/g.47503  ORF Transcript_47053/g.47503 Transcript_47053/m.47503 type:complete len:115 (+) Transcript_47053:212-556(+)
MMNVDGVYAANEIQPDTILFHEKDMPDVELPRSKDPNCIVVELEGEENEEDAARNNHDDDDYKSSGGTMALVSKRFIPCGEFLCVAESSSDESGSSICNEEDEWEDIDNDEDDE